jgi:hemolysin activation/secretion protein
MAIALPPPITPQPASAVELRTESRQQQALSIDYKGTQIHVFGGNLPPADKLRRAVAAADNLSDVIRAVGYVYYLDGYPAALVSYAVVLGYEKDVYVRVTPGKVSEVTGPAELLPYFNNLKNGKPLTAQALESDRALADGLSNRAGEQFQPQFKPAGDDQVVLDLGQPAPGPRQFSAAASFSNYGNRYAGPELVGAGLRASLSSGDELGLSGVSDARFLGFGGNHYQEGDAAWSRISRFGVFGVQGQYADFRENLSSYQLDGKLDSISATWLYPLYTDFQHRLNLQAKLERDHEAIDEIADVGVNSCNLVGDLLQLLGLVSCTSSNTVEAEALSEQYNSAELTLSYVGRSEHDGRTNELQAALALRKGLGPAHAAGSAARLDYLAIRPALSARYSFTPHWAVIGEGSAQFSGGTAPQQQQFVIGGPTSLHAYTSGTGVGDRGENGRISVEWKSDGDSWTERHGIRPHAFVEYGTATLDHGAVGGAAAAVSLADAGLSTDLRFTSWLSGGLSAAQSFYNHGAQYSPNGLDKKYVFFQLAAKY